tara:strand:+ start:372 stop:629 length:258 start_codon:yes stop_codon:yes gene_type:complete
MTDYSSNDEIHMVFNPDLAIKILDYIQKESDDNVDVAVFHMMCCIVSLVQHREQAILLLNLTYDFAEKFRKAYEDGKLTDETTIH